MTKKKGSKLLTKKTRSEMYKSTINSELRVHAYIAPNYHLCHNYTETGSVLTVHKSAQSSTIVECNRYYTTFSTLAKLPFTPTKG